MARGRVPRGLTAALLALGVLLVIVVGAAIWVSRDLERRSERAYVKEAIPTKSAAQDLVLQMVNEATGVRSYVASGDEADLAPYRMGLAGVRRALARLERSTGNHPELRGALESARGRVIALQRFYRSQVALTRSGPRGQGVAHARVDRGRAPFNRFRDAASALAAETDAFVARTSADQHDRYHGLLLVLGLLGAAALAVAAALVIIVPRRASQLLAERAARLDAEREARETLDRVLAVTPRFLDGIAPEEVTERVCEAAIDAFGCAAAELWLSEGDDLRLSGRVPPGSENGSLPGVRRAREEGGVLYVPDESQLDVPSTVGVLALQWHDGAAEP